MTEFDLALKQYNNLITKEVNGNTEFSVLGETLTLTELSPRCKSLSLGDLFTIGFGIYVSGSRWVCTSSGKEGKSTTPRAESTSSKYRISGMILELLEEDKRVSRELVPYIHSIILIELLSLRIYMRSDNVFNTYKILKVEDGVISEVLVNVGDMFNGELFNINRTIKGIVLVSKDNYDDKDLPNELINSLGVKLNGIVYVSKEGLTEEGADFISLTENDMKDIIDKLIK